MDIEVNGIKLEEDQFEAIVKLKGNIKDSFSRYTVTEAVNRHIVSKIADKYLAKNSANILSNINIDELINAVKLEIIRNVR